MKRFIKSYRIPFPIIAIVAIACAVAFSGWADEYRERQHDEQQYEKSAARLARMAVGAQAAVAITMQGRQYEATKAGSLDADLMNAQAALRSAYGKQGSLTRQLNDANARACQLEKMLRDNGVMLYQRNECAAAAASSPSEVR